MAGRPPIPKISREGVPPCRAHQLLPQVLPILKKGDPWQRVSGRLDGTLKSTVDCVLNVVERASGGNVAEFLQDMFRGKKDCLWHACFGDVSLSTTEFAPLIGKLKESGWTWSEAEAAGIPVSKNQWYYASSSEEKTVKRGRPLNDKVRQAVLDAWNEASTDSSIVSKRLSTKDHAVCIRHVAGTYTGVYRSSGLEGSVSRSWFMALRPPEIWKAKRRTDVCEYCLLAQTYIGRIKVLLTQYPAKATRKPPKRWGKRETVMV